MPVLAKLMSLIGYVQSFVNRVIVLVLFLSTHRDMDV